MYAEYHILVGMDLSENDDDDENPYDFVAKYKSKYLLLSMRDCVKEDAESELKHTMFKS